ncbi:MAG: acyl carrier protein [Betaproteobacteria bacterium]
MQDVKQAVRQFLLDNFLMGSGAVIADDASFMKGHVLDSSGFMELILFLEESFGVKVEDAELVPENLDSLNNIEAFVARKREARAAA